MYFEGIEENQTRLWIINSLLGLLERKEYHDITINMIVDHAALGRRTFYRYFKTKDDAMKYITERLMEQFADTIIRNDSHGIEGVTISYFQFWEQYIDILHQVGRFLESHRHLVRGKSSQITRRNVKAYYRIIFLILIQKTCSYIKL